MILAGCPSTPSTGNAGTASTPNLRPTGRLVLLDPAPWSSHMLAALGERVTADEERLVLREDEVLGIVEG